MGPFPCQKAQRIQALMVMDLLSTVQTWLHCLLKPLALLSGLTAAVHLCHASVPHLWAPALATSTLPFYRRPLGCLEPEGDSLHPEGPLLWGLEGAHTCTLATLPRRLLL